MSLFWSGSCRYSNFLLKNTKVKSSFIKKRLNHENSSNKSEISIQAKNLDEKNKFIPFNDMINIRRTEARKSILVLVRSEKSFKDLHAYCSLYGNVKEMLHYKAGKLDPKHFILVEFATESDIANIFSESSHHKESVQVSIASQFLWFKASKQKLKPSVNAVLTIEDGINVIDNTELKKQLQKCQNVSEQMKLLYDKTKLNNLGTRLRFLTARQLELNLSGIFPNASALPFGSCVNGYGKMGCDVDLIFRVPNDKRTKNESRLYFICKTDIEMSQRRNMELIGNLIDFFIPGCVNVRKILEARVPILKYYQQFTDVECDLSVSNLSGYHMSDFLYMMASIDDRVRILVFTIKKWASEIGLTNRTPGHWITNFSLTLLVLAFLQKPLNSQPILPSLNLLKHKAGPQDKYITENGIDCTFLRDINKLNFKTENNNSLEELLVEFFEFYSQFDFTKNAICLNDGTSVRKTNHNPLHIVNPLECDLNVSRNVNYNELERFQLQARNAAWILQSQQDNKEENWGLLSLFQNTTKNYEAYESRNKKKDRLLEVNTLFQEGQEIEEENKFNNEQVENKNMHVKKQIANIKKETRDTIKKLSRLSR